MAKEKSIAIETEIGTLVGRDCIYLDKIKLDNSGSSLRLKGGFVGNNLNSIPSDKEYDYTLTFTHIIALKMTELEAYMNTSKSEGCSCFDEIFGSSWLQGLTDSDQVSGEYREFYLGTYDLVFQIVSQGFELSISSTPKVLT